MTNTFVSTPRANAGRTESPADARGNSPRSDPAAVFTSRVHQIASRYVWSWWDALSYATIGGVWRSDRLTYRAVDKPGKRQ